MPAAAPKVVWQPLPGSQALALGCPCHHILYHGNRGPGKTDAQLMRFRLRVGQGYGAFWRGVIFDREYKNLDDLVAKSERWFNRFEDGAKFKSSKADYRWTWPTGEELLFRQIKRPSDYYSYHGQEFPFIGWNELTKYPNPDLYDAMMSCNRTSFRPEDYPLDSKGKLAPPIPLEVFSTTNPYGPGHNWVKRRFIDAAPPGQIVRRVINVWDPQTGGRRDIIKTQVHIFGSYKENKYLSPEYVAELESISDPNRRKAWLHGDWNVVAGGAVDDLWDPAITVVRRFRVPRHWHVDRSLDWGSSKPFSVGWWAEANGEEVRLQNGRRWCPQAGSLIRIAELYGSKEIGSNEGLRMSATEVARKIKEIEAQLIKEGWVEGEIEPGPADNSIHEVRERDTDSIAKKMLDEGIVWNASDKGPGSRKNGFQLIRDRLEADLKYPEKPGLYFTENCEAALLTIPTLPRDPDDPDDVDTDSEDHAWDDTRYRVLAGNSRMARVLPMRVAY